MAAAACRSAELLVFRDGRPASAADLALPALVNDGHFTTMQVRGRAVQGFGLHLKRLDHASRLLSGGPLDPARVRADCLAALVAAGMEDATLRVTVHHPGDRPAPLVLVSLAAPATAGISGLRLKSFAWVRALPEIKHAGTFPLFHHRRLARAAGADDALLTTADGRICEGTFWNLALWDGRRVLWPDGPALRGTRERLLQAVFGHAGVPQQVRPVRLAELPGLAGIACNARGVQALAGVDGLPLADPAPLLALAADATAATPWEPIGQGMPTTARSAPL